MDINLSNLSKKGRKNFFKYFKKRYHTKIDIIASVIIVLCGTAIIILENTLLRNCRFFFEITSFLLIASSTIFYILFIIRTFKNINKFYHKDSNDGLFDYCFECNKSIELIDYKCPKCDTETYFAETDNKIDYGLKKQVKCYFIREILGGLVVGVILLLLVYFFILKS